MIIFLDARGDIITTSLPEPIGRNSNDAGVIYVVAPISQAANIYMTFTLPNGEPLFGDVLEKVSNGEDVGDCMQASYIFTLPDGTLSVWRYRVPASVTRLAGIVQYTIVTVTDGMRATASGTFTVSRGNRLTIPNDPTPDAWNRVLGALGYQGADIEQIFVSLYGSNGTADKPAEGGVLWRLQSLEKSDATNSEDIADLQQSAKDLREINKSIIDDLPSLHLDGTQPLSIVLEKAQEYWNDQEPQVVVSGTTLFRLLDDDGSIKPVERDIPPFTRVSFDLGGNVPRGTAYMSDRIVRFEVVGEIADNTIKITNDMTLESVSQRSEDNAQGVSELTRTAARSVSFDMLNDAANKKEYVLRVSLKNADGNETSYAEVDLPLEMAFVDAKLNEDGTKIIFELQNGKTVELPTEALMRWKEALKVDFTVAEEGKFIRYNGEITAGNKTAYSAPIPVAKGEMLSFTARGSGTNVAMISVCDADGGNIVPKIISFDSEVRDYQYRVEADGFVLVSYLTNYEHTLLSYGAESNKVLREDLNEAKSAIVALDEATKATGAKVDGLTFSRKAEYTFTQNQFINTSGVITSAYNVAYSSPVAVSAGETVVFHAYVKETMAAISTCDENGENIVPKAIGKSVNDVLDDYIYQAETDGYVVFSFFNSHNPHGHDATIYGEKSNISLHGEIEKLKNMANPGGGNIELAQTLDGNEEDKAPSVKAVKDALSATGVGFPYTKKAEYTFTQGSYVSKIGVITTANNVAYSSPIALNAGEAIVLHAYVKDTMAAISTCDENGENIVPKVIGKGENEIHDDYFYRADADIHVVLSFYYNHNHPSRYTNSATIYGEKSNLVLHGEIEKIKAEDTIFTRCEEQIENIFAGCDYHRQETKEKNFALMMVSDLHGDTQRLTNAIDLLNGCDAIDAGIMLGDMESGAPSANITTYVAEMNKAEKPFFAVLGNHDVSQDATTTGTILTTLATSRYLKQINTADIYTERGYGYKDFDTHKIRLIILNQHDYPENKTSDGKWVYWGKTMYLQEQIDWFISTLASTPNDYTVIVACHHVQNFENNDTINNLHRDCKTRNLWMAPEMGYLTEDVIGKIVDAFKKKTTLSETYAYTLQEDDVTGLSVNADFSARTQSLFAVHIGGHTHSQFIGNKKEVENQLVYVHDISCGIRNGGWTEFSLFPRNQGGKSQDLITVLCVDTENQMVNLVRVGANRTIYMEDYDVLNVPFVQ